MMNFDAQFPTFRLFGVPSYLDGVTMALDYAHTMPEFNTAQTPEQTDMSALSADWQAVGADLSMALSAFGSE